MPKHASYVWQDLALFANLRTNGTIETEDSWYHIVGIKGSFDHRLASKMVATNFTAFHQDCRPDAFVVAPRTVSHVVAFNFSALFSKLAALTLLSRTMCVTYTKFKDSRTQLSNQRTNDTIH
ncbi:unnamed protein product [Bursaphelenchus okinawaensis]|uniref:Uncharacterized protein n=1 Tax=Bursaphelenchus okinawaensis TaxID=465554 RepID=A0A811KBN0_9BILA|nr:unnamed protein product [Bursaphelenchus okinawaensis]CAG9101073.1 unnamed protein product [Bursaphelenchus okinawaensis]